MLTLTQALASFAQNSRNFIEAERLYTQYAEVARKCGREESEATAFHQLGRVAQERRDFDAAESWYNKALEIFERYDDQHSVDVVRHSLARLKNDIDSEGQLI